MPHKAHPAKTALLAVGVAVAGVALTLVFGIGALFATGLVVFFWALRDAGKSTKARKGRRQVKPGRDGDMSDVAGLAKREPWLG